jgi:hypothetical protein
MATGEKPDLSKLHQFGCTAWIKNPKAGKLDSRTIEGKFLGYDEESKGYRIYWLKKQTVTVERDIYFDENEALIPETTQIEEGRITKVDLHSPATSTTPKNLETTQEQPPEPVYNSDDPPTIQEPAPHKKTTWNDGLIKPKPNTGRGL